MSIHVLVTGVLQNEAVSRISQNGNTYVTCSVRTEQDGQTLWANVICFDELAQAELLRLDAGDALSVQGKATPKIYMKDDEPRPSLQVTASHVLVLKPKYEPKIPQPRYEPPKPKATAKKAKAKSAKTVSANARSEEEQTSDEGFDDPLDF